MSKKIKDEQKKFLGETLNQYDKALDEAINQLDKKNREQNHKISSLVNSFDNEYLEKDVEGNMTALENSKDGMVIINEIQGNTEVNYCKDGEKELILNGDIDTQGKSFVTLTEGVDGGLVDVLLEGNTEVNLSSTKDPVLVTREFDDINCNAGKLQYTIDDVTTINDEPGKVDIDRIVGDTMVNHAVNGSEELILNAHINESGDNNITLNGVTSDGGLVDVALEGNTMVNVCDQKDPVAITKSYTVETGNHVALQGEYDGKCRPVVTGNTLWIDNDTEDVLTAFDESKNLRLQSSFEDKVVTQEMVDSGEELAENLGKYRVKYKVTGKNLFDTNDLLLHQNNNGMTVNIENNKLYIEGTATGIYDFRPISPTYNKVLFDKVNNAPVGTSFTLSNSIGGANYWRLTRDGKTQFITNTITKQQGDSNINAFVRIMTGTSISKSEFNIQVEEGDTPTAYEPYKEYTKTFYLNSPLLEGDTIEQQGNNVVHVHRYKEEIFNGDETFTKHPNETDNTLMFTCVRANAYDDKFAEYCYSDKFNSKRVYNEDNEGFYSGSDLACFRILKSKLQTQDIAGFKQWLQQNPTTVVYKLETPQYEVISQNDSILCDSYTNGHLDVDSVVPIERVEFKNWWGRCIKYLYSSTNYTVQFMSDNIGILNIAVGTLWTYNIEVVKGINKFKFTSALTPNEYIVLDGIGFNASNIVVTEATDQDFGYFEGMKSVGECEDLEVVSSNSDGTLSNTQTLTHEPLRAVGDIKDKYVLIDGKWYIERNCGVRAYQEGDKDNYITDMINTVYPLQTPTYEPINYNPFTVYSDTTYISNNSTIPCNMIIKNHGYNTIALKENTLYTLYVDKNTTNALTYRLGDYVEINSLSKFTFTTPSALTDKTLRIDGKGTKVKDLMLIEGTPTNDSIGYFDGLKSSYECEQVTDELDENYGKYKVDVKVVGKNLFDKSKTLDGYEIANILTGVLRENADWFVTDFIPVIPNTSYRISGKAKGAVGLCYDKNKQLISSLPFGCDGAITITIPNNVRYVKLNGLLTQKDTFQLEKGNTASEYEPYFESKQTVYLNSPLLKGDEIVWKDNKIQHYHKMGIGMLDGSVDEDWRFFNGDFIEKVNTLDFYIPNYPGINKSIVISDKFKTNNGGTYLKDEEAISGTDGSGTNIWLSINKSRINPQNINGLKEWLSNNPIKFVYTLATPYYEEISDYPLKLNVIANSSLSTESTIQVTNISFNIYEETLPYLYSNTKYYITFNADVDRNNIIIDLGGNHVIFDCKVGFNKVEITTPSNTTNLLTFSGTGVNIDHVKVTQQDIDEYFEGMKSVGECEELEITSANSDNTLLNTQTLTHEPLRAVGNVKDRYVLIDNKWYIERRCGEIALESLQWEYNSTITNSGNTFAYTGGIPNILVQRQVTKNYFLCNIVEATKVHNHEVDKEQITQFIHSSGIALRISRDKLQDNSVDSLNEYLSNNNAKLVYQLATPVYEEIDYNPFEVYPDVTHITTNSLIPTNVVVKNHGYNCILKPSTTYTIALNKPNGTISAKLGGSAKVDSTNSVFTITTPSTLNDNVLRLSGSGNVKDIMILEGDKTINTPSYFEGIESTFEQEYDAEKGKYRVTAKVEGNSKESTIIFYINEPLRGTGTAKDKVYIKDDKVVVQRNCEEVVLDGSENWEIYRNLDNYKTIHFKSRLIEKMLPPNTNKAWGDNICLSNIFLTDKHYTMYVGEDREFLSISNNINEGIAISINKNKLQSQDVQGFKQWLQQNPVTVVYELAEPVYELADCDLSKLVLENYENSSLIFESNIPVSANIRYSGEVPVVTQAKSLSSQVDNTTLDINENIIPYMCDIDYRIVELQLMNGDTQGEGIELLGIGDIEILSNENVLFNNREDKKYNYSYDMLKRDILSQRYSKEEYQYRLDRYLLANKISDEEYKELEGLLNNGE